MGFNSKGSPGWWLRQILSKKGFLRCTKRQEEHTLHNCCFDSILSTFTKSNTSFHCFCTNCIFFSSRMWQRKKGKWTLDSSIIGQAFNEVENFLRKSSIKPESKCTSILLIIAIVISSFKYVCQIEHNTLLFGKEMPSSLLCASLQNFGNLCNTFTLPTSVVLFPYSTIISNCLLVNFVCEEEQNTITFYVAEFCYTCEKVFVFRASI